jgi:4-amino-4-deoxy-L-arabinose transferase-like glycosyltransferase
VTVLVRAAFAFIYPVKNFPATSEYYERAQQFLSGDYSNYIGKNTPLYSWLIIAVGFNRNLLVLLQALLGSGVAVMLYLLFSRLSGSRLVGLLAGLSYSLNPSQLLFEFALLPECAGIGRR